MFDSCMLFTVDVFKRLSISGDDCSSDIFRIFPLVKAQVKGNFTKGAPCHIATMFKNHKGVCGLE